MGKIIDISSKITNELPVVKITDEIVVTVNNRRSTILNVQAMTKELERKTDDEEYDEMAFMNKVLELIVGGKKVKEINDLDLPFPEYKEVYNAIFGAATGDYGDTPTDGE
mgnify:CR=1 FL=1